MPAAKRKTAGKKRTGTAAAAKILLALSGDDGDGGGCDGGEDSRKQRRVEFIEGLVGDLKKKGATIRWRCCRAMHWRVAPNIIELL